MRKKIYFWKVILVFLCVSLFAIFGMANARTTILDRLQTQVQEKSQVRLEEFEKNRAELRELMNQKRIELQNQIQQKREELKQERLEFQNQLRERLEKIKDERKRLIVERIYQMINTLNERVTNHYLNVLNQLEEKLERIESRTAKAKLNNIDTTQVERKISEAQDAIDKAREAVKNQAQKIYSPPQITSEENLRENVGKLRKELHDDLKKVENLVKEARDKVREAAVTLAQIRNIDQLEIPSPSVSPNP